MFQYLSKQVSTVNSFYKSLTKVKGNSKRCEVEKKCRLIYMLKMQLFQIADFI